MSVFSALSPLPLDLFHRMDTSPFLHSLLIGIWDGFWLWDISKEGAMNNLEQTLSHCVPIHSQEMWTILSYFWQPYLQLKV